ncbi:MAG: hypothetical protein V4699_00360 [Patescibacteria group bacterium]
MLVVALSGSADEATKPTHNRLDNVYLRNSDQWSSLDTIIDTAWMYLVSKTNVPPSARYKFVVMIDRADTNNLAVISFGGGVAQQFWEVRVGASGKAQSYITGLATDVHRARLK